MKGVTSKFLGKQASTFPHRQIKAQSARAQTVQRSQHPTPHRRDRKEAVLLAKFRGHEAAVSAVLVASDTENGKELVTSSLDKSVALWEIPMTDDGGVSVLEKSHFTPEGAPIFSLVEEPPSFEVKRRQIFCGNAAKSVVSWNLPAKSFDKTVKLNGHTGWVRALATNGRWLFSTGCNKISQWDLSRSVPRKFNEINIFTGDVQGLVMGGGCLFSCGADGSIRSWKVGKKGEMQPAAFREKAHKGRISNLAYKSGFLYSVSLDGNIKMWDASSMELVMNVNGAHDGGKIHCVTVGPEGNLYTGGEDKLVRRWELGTLTPSGGGSLYCHNYPVRALASGNLETLVSADSSGEVAVWKI